MKPAKPIFDSATHYQIEIEGRADVEWLQSFDSSVEISVEETRQAEDITVLRLHTDQSGIIGLLRRLHSLGITIQQVQIFTKGE